MEKEQSVSDRRRAARIKETIEVVTLFLENNARNVSCRRNELELSNKIMKQDLKWYPCQIVARDELHNPDYVMHFQFFQWFLNECRNRRFSANIIFGDEAGFLLNHEVDSRNVRHYAPVDEPPNFSQRRT